MNPDRPPRERPDFDRVVADEFPGDERAAELIDRFLRQRRSYDRAFVEDLIQLASSPADGSWEVRRLSALILQQQFLRLPAGERVESLAFLDRLGMMSHGGRPPRLKADVLKQGYTTTRPVEFLREFRRHLERLSSIISRASGRRITADRLRDFLDASRDDCQVALARYVFRPEEVADRILASVRRSAGQPADFTFDYSEGEARRAAARLPEFEAGILKALRDGGEAYWVDDRTSTELNALVEQPIRTVVLTVKPPGSRIEIEIKRAGHRGDRPLGIVHNRGGRPVPPPHRLDGGSSAQMLQWEAGHGACLARLYRLVHRSEAPISITTAINHVDAIPVGGGRTAHLLDYFSDPSVFGGEFPRLSEARRQAIDAFAKERGDGLSGLRGPWAETLRFLQYTVPAQSLLVRSSSFRLDLLCRYLSPEGPALYFGDAWPDRVTADVARRFADACLHEVLGLYGLPIAAYESHNSYLDAAFARPDNRARANRVHASLSRQLGTFWGTVLAFRAYSFGESFVARNVGLRTVWEQGRWAVRILFMDHDNLNIPGTWAAHFEPAETMPGTIADESHVMGHLPKLQPLSGAVDYLRAIYRIDDEAASRHLNALRRSAARAYRRADRALSTSDAIRRIIPAEYVANCQAWDRAVAIYLRHQGTADEATWTAEADALLHARGAPADLRRRYLDAIGRFAPFLIRNAFLFTDRPRVARVARPSGA